MTMTTDKYPAPKLVCKCGVMLSATQKKRVKYRESERTGMTDWKILERYYYCPKCKWHVWHEVMAKEPEEGVL